MRRTDNNTPQTSTPKSDLNIKNIIISSDENGHYWTIKKKK